MARIIDAGISTKHASNWTIEESIREVLQNWIDVTNEYGVGGKIAWEDGIALIKDAGPGLQMRHLAFGENDKYEESIGQFGEGLKSALLTLVRNERKVWIQTNGMVITPVIKRSANFETDTLHFKISELTPRLAARLKGTHVRIQCSEQELNQGQAYFVQLSTGKIGSDVAFEWLDKDHISLPGGRVYVKGSMVGTIKNAKFSYHLDGPEAKSVVNRDRNTINMNLVEAMVAGIISGTSSTQVMRTVLEDMVTETVYWESTLSLNGEWGGKPQVWRRVWNELAGEDVVISGEYSQDREASYRGYKLVKAGWRQSNFLQSFGVYTSGQMLAVIASKSKPRLGKISVSDLPEAELKTYRYVKRMVKKYYRDPGKVVVVESLEAFSNNAVSFGGMYDPDKSIIYVTLKTLAGRRWALHVVLHETVHKVSGADDLTEEFERALLEVAVNMIERTEK